MRTLAIAATLALAPAVASAQGSVQAQSSTSTSASVRSERALSADAQATVDANIRVAREHQLPEEPIRQRVAEGQAKGASDAQVAAASTRTLAELRGSFDAMVRAGRAEPSNEEVSRGAQLMARGYTEAQIEAVARKAPSDRSLVVAFETLTSLQARGVSTGRAIAQVGSRLSSRASDAQLRVLADAHGTAGVASTSAVSGAASAAAGGAASTIAGSAAAGAGASGAGVLGGATSGVAGSAGVAGTVSGALGKRP